MTQPDRESKARKIYFALQSMYDTHTPGWQVGGYDHIREQTRYTNEQIMFLFSQALAHDGFDYWFPRQRNTGRLLLDIVGMWLALMHQYDEWSGSTRICEEWQAANPKGSSADAKLVYERDHHEEARTLNDLFDVPSYHTLRDPLHENACRNMLLNYDDLREEDGYIHPFHVLNLLVVAGFTFDDLYCAAMGKIALDTLRLQHGVLDGSYQRVWDGMDDEWHLLTVLKTADRQSPTFQEDVHAALAARYPGLAS